jgi:hypothetical protein
MMNYALTIKTYSITFTIDQTSCALLDMGEVIETYCEEWAFVSTS